MAHFAALNVLVDNGIFEIYIGSDGKLHIRWILPDPPPDILSEIAVVSEIVNQSALLKDRAIAEKFRGFAEEVLNSRAEVIGGFMAQAGRAAGNAQ